MAVRFVSGSAGYKLFLHVNRVSFDCRSVSLVTNTNMQLNICSQIIVVNVEGVTMLLPARS